MGPLYISEMGKVAVIQPYPTDQTHLTDDYTSKWIMYQKVG